MALSVRSFTVVVSLALVTSCGGDKTVTPASTSPATTVPALALTTLSSTSTATPTTAPTTTVAPLPTVRYDKPGPYAAGVTTVQLGDRAMEVWYPTSMATVAGQSTEKLDTLTLFPENLRAIIPKELVALIDTKSYRDAPANTAKKWPLVIYSHGFGGYRQVATFHTSHLASWGFVVAAVDHVERGLIAQATNQIVASPGKDIADINAAIAKLAEMNATGPLAGTIDTAKFAISGHSAGAGIAIRAANELPAVTGFVSISGGPLAGADGTTTTAGPAKPGLVLLGEKDIVVPPARSVAVYDSLRSPRTLVAITNAGHNSFTDTCPAIRDRGGIEQLRPLIGRLVDLAQDGCTPDRVDPVAAERVMNHYSTAFLVGLSGQAVAPSTFAKGIATELGAPLSDYKREV